MSFVLYGRQCEAKRSRNRALPLRCGREGRVRNSGSLVCYAHHVHGFIPFAPDVTDEQQEARMRRVVEGFR